MFFFLINTFFYKSTHFAMKLVFFDCDFFCVFCNRKVSLDLLILTGSQNTKHPKSGGDQNPVEMDEMITGRARKGKFIFRAVFSKISISRQVFHYQNMYFSKFKHCLDFSSIYGSLFIQDLLINLRLDLEFLDPASNPNNIGSRT